MNFWYFLAFLDRARRAGALSQSLDVQPIPFQPVRSTPNVILITAFAGFCLLFLYVEPRV